MPGTGKSDKLNCLPLRLKKTNDLLVTSAAISKQNQKLWGGGTVEEMLLVFCFLKWARKDWDWEKSSGRLHGIHSHGSPHSLPCWAGEPGRNHQTKRRGRGGEKYKMWRPSKNVVGELTFFEGTYLKQLFSKVVEVAEILLHNVSVCF